MSGVDTAYAAGFVDSDLDAAAFREALSRHGSMPLPPYIKRARGGDPRDHWDYQTIFARTKGRRGADRWTSLHPLPPRGDRPRDYPDLPPSSAVCACAGKRSGSPRAIPHSVATPSTRTWLWAAARRAALPAMSSR